MKGYFITLLVYLFAFTIAYALSGDLFISLLSMVVATIITLYYFRKDFKFRIRFDFLAIVSGLGITVVWIWLDPFYPHLSIQDPVQYTFLSIFPKLIISVILAPIIEEFFTRHFLLRYIIKKDFRRVLPHFTWASFIITVLFFGFAHSRWLAGIITGIILNLLYYKRKEIGPCILSHATANLALAVYVISNNAWTFW